MICQNCGLAIPPPPPAFPPLSPSLNYSTAQFMCSSKWLLSAVNETVSIFQLVRRIFVGPVFGLKFRKIVRKLQKMMGLKCMKLDLLFGFLTLFWVDQPILMNCLTHNGTFRSPISSGRYILVRKCMNQDYCPWLSLE